LSKSGQNVESANYNLNFVLLTENARASSSGKTATAKFSIYIDQILFQHRRKDIFSCSVFLMRFPDNIVGNLDDCLFLSFL
jgi:hypothetical protein